MNIPSLDDALAREFWDMSAAELDTTYIQQPIGERMVHVTRWKTLPTAAFRNLKQRPEASGTFESLEVEAFKHGIVHRDLNGRAMFCVSESHIEDGLYAVDPDRPSRVETFVRLFNTKERVDRFIEFYRASYGR